MLHAHAVAAVHDGYVLNASIMCSLLGGRLLNECLQASLESKGVKLHPWYLYGQAHKASGAGTETIIRESGNITESHIRWGTEFLASDIKESHCRMNELPFVEEDNINMPMQTYELPDGSNVDIGVERFKIPEILFSPVRGPAHFYVLVVWEPPGLGNPLVWEPPGLGTPWFGTLAAFRCSLFIP
jgi:actin-like protein 6A